MCGIKNGVSDKNPYIHFMHCCGCALNLVKNVRFLKDSMDTIYEIVNLIKISPKRDGMLQKTQKDKPLEYPRFRVLCPKRWTARAESMKSILDNCIPLQQVCDKSID